MNRMSACESGYFCSQIIDNHMLTNKNNMITVLAQRNRKSRDRAGSRPGWLRVRSLLVARCQHLTVPGLIVHVSKEGRESLSHGS